MKKLIICFVVLMTMVAAVTTFAAGINNIRSGQAYLPDALQLSMQGTHCNGTVGCNCPGFSPITNGDVWQQAYCRHCGHKKGVHK